MIYVFFLTVTARAPVCAAQSRISSHADPFPRGRAPRAPGFVRRCAGVGEGQADSGADEDDPRARDRRQGIRRELGRATPRRAGGRGARVRGQVRGRAGEAGREGGVDGGACATAGSGEIGACSSF